MQNQYNKMWTLYQNGRITSTCWFNYCNLVTLQIMYNNREVYVRMKYV